MGFLISAASHNSATLLQDSMGGEGMLESESSHNHNERGAYLFLYKYQVKIPPALLEAAGQ